MSKYHTFFKRTILKSFSFAVISLSAFSQDCTKFFDKSLFNDNEKMKLQAEVMLHKWESSKCKKDSVFYKIVAFCLKNSVSAQNEVQSKIVYNKLNLEFVYKSTDVKFKRTIYTELANYYKFIKDKNEEIKIHERICEEFKPDLSQHSLVSNSYFRLYSIYFQMGDYEKSLRMIQQCEIFAIKINDFEKLSLVHQAIAKIYLKLGKNNDIYNQLKIADEYAKKSRNPEIIGSAFRNKGYFLTSIKEYQEAIKAFRTSFVQYEKINSYNQSALQFLDIGFIYYDNLNDFKKANEYYFKALNLTDDEFIKLRLYDNIGAVYWKQKDYKNALKYYQLGMCTVSYLNFKSVDISKNISASTLKNTKLKDFFLTLLQDKALCWLDYAKATNNNKEYLLNALKTYEVTDKLIDYMRQEQTGTQSKFFWRQKTRSIYESAIETCYLLEDYQKAFYFFEKSRSVLLNDKLNELGAKQKLSESDKQQEKDFLRQISSLNASIEKEVSATEKTKLSNQLLDLQEKQDNFIKSLETKNPAYYQIKYDTTTVTLKRFQTYLAAVKGQAVEYFMGDVATYAIVISASSVSIKKLNYQSSASQQLLDFCSKNINTKAELSQFLAVSSDVFKSLIEPLNLQKGRLIISQDGAFIPFEALSKSATKPEYLLYDFAISYTYSAQFLLKNRQKTTFLPQNKFLGIAPVNFTQKMSPLKGSVESLDKIAKNYFCGSTLVEQAGSKKAFLSSAKNHQIVQIYTHAFADSNETEPRIYFADSTLKVSELSMEEQFKTNLLVLSACKTGVGKVAKGEGVLSLARGFSMVGIPATITSLWSIEDTDTYTLTEFFYEYLNEGLPKDEALQQAKIAFIASKQNAMPNTWAGMILIGDSSAITANYWIVGAVLIGLILIAFVFFFWLKKTKAI